MTTIHPYLTFNGSCEAAFNFYKAVFGGEFTYIGRFSEMPPEFPVLQEEQNKIMHIALPIGEGTVLLGSDSSDTFGHATTPGDNFSISLNTDSEAETHRIFYALSEGGKITMPLEKTFWGALFGTLVDPFGIQWMVNFEYKKD